MKKINVKIVSIFPQHSALWKYAYFLEKELKKNKTYSVEFIDFWKEKKYHNKFVKTLVLLKGINIKKTEVLICVAPLLAKSLIKSKAKLKIVIAHDLYPLTVGKKVSLFEKLLVSITYKYMKHANIILAVSNFCKKDVLKKYGLKNKLSVLPGGIDHTSFKKLETTKEQLRKKHNLPLKKKILLHIGRDDHRKNVSFLIKLLKKLGDDYVLVKIGDINIKKNIILVKNIDEKKLCEIYNAVDLLLFPSLYEGLGLPPIEAMACGLPVLAANKTGLKEVCIEESLTELNEMLWLEKINEILSNRNLRLNMIKKGLEQSKKFDWKIYANTIKKIIETGLK